MARFTRKDVSQTGTNTRVKGEEFQLAGVALYLYGSLRTGTEVAFDRQDAERIPVDQIRLIRVPEGFTSVWVFQSDTTAFAVGFSMLAFATLDPISLAPSPQVRISTPYSGRDIMPIGALNNFGQVDPLTLASIGGNGDNWSITNGYLGVEATNSVYNGATGHWDRLRSGNASDLAAQSGKGSALVHLPGDWTMVSASAAGSINAQTKAAGGGTVRRIITSICASCSSAAAAQTPLNFYVRDGASGAGTILFAQSFQLPVNGLWSLSVSGLNIVCSPNTSLTAEFNLAPAAGGLQSFTITGHDAQ